MADGSYKAYQREELASATKAAADATAKLSAAIKGLERAAAQGDLDRIKALASGLEDLARAAGSASDALKGTINQFDFDAYLTGGGFHADFVAACQAQELPVEGQFPVYEIFPVRVRIVPERRRAQIGQRTVRQLEPETLAALVRRDIDSLARRAFNATQFLKEVSHAYDVVVAIREKEARLKTGTAAGRDGIPMPARDVYEELAPTRAAQSLYTISMFAYDLGRLQKSGGLSVDGRHVAFGSTREGSRALRSFDSTGRETFIGTILFSRESA